jgi:choice-of-anchor C domain-containing protein
VAVNDSATTNEDSAISIAVLANDSDVDLPDTKTLVSTTGAQHGTASISGSNVVYTPSANYNGADSFTYTMKDAVGATSTATVNVTVTPVSDTYTLKNLIVNGSFEQFGSGNTSTGSTAITGWTVTGSDVDRVASSGWQSGDGTYSLDLNGFHPGGVQQVLQTTPGVQYTVGFELSKNPGGHADHATVQVSVDNTDHASQLYTFNAANSDSNMMWSQQTFTFVATGTTTTLSFASTYPTDSTGGFPINAEGPALDEVVAVSNKVISDFTTGAGGDVLDLHDLLTSVSAPHDVTSFTGGFLKFLDSNGAADGGDTLVQVDSNGGGDSFVTLATLTGQLLAQTDTANYLL